MITNITNLKMSNFFHRLNDVYQKFGKNGDYVLISIERQKANQTSSRVFSCYQNINEFIEWYLSLDDELKVIYEVIRGNKSQKPYFDIDIPRVEMEYDESLELIKTLINLITKRIGCDPEDIFTFTSHGSNKLSYHIVIDRWFVPSYLHNKQLYDEIMNNFPEKWKKYIDCLYSKTQQFRVLGSHKITNPDRIKCIARKSTWKSHSQYNNDVWLASLITHTSDCKLISIKPAEFRERKFTSLKTSYGTKQLRDIIEDKLEGNYDLEQYQDGGYRLKRISRGLVCPICDRAHDVENASLYINFEGDVLFNCFRDQNGHSKLIGWVDIDSDDKFAKEAKNLKSKTLENNKEDDYYDEKSDDEYIPNDIVPLQSDISFLSNIMTNTSLINSKTKCQLKSVGSQLLFKNE